MIGYKVYGGFYRVSGVKKPVKVAADPKCIQISSFDDYLQQSCYETVIKLSHAAVAAIYFAHTEMHLSLLYNDLGIHRHFFKFLISSK